MDDATRNVWQVGIAIAQLIAVLVGAGWAYFRFWRQRTHWPALDLDTECRTFGLINGLRVVELSVLLENKGHVEHRFRRISLHLRGIRRDDAVSVVHPSTEVLRFPVELVRIENLVSDADYYFVRPGVKERITRPFAVPAEIQFLRLYAEFEYEQKDFVHGAQRVYELPNA